MIDHLLKPDIKQHTLDPWRAQMTQLAPAIQDQLKNTLGMDIAIRLAQRSLVVALVSQRLIEVLSSFPTLILAMLLAVGLGPGLGTVIVGVGVTQIPLATRVTRSVVLSVKHMQFVEAAR